MNPEQNDSLTQASQLIRSGQLPEAQRILFDYIKRNPSSEQGWLLLSSATADPAQQIDCLKRVLKINPANQPASQRLAQLSGKPGPTTGQAAGSRDLPVNDLSSRESNGSPKEEAARPSVTFRPASASFSSKSKLAQTPKQPDEDLLAGLRDAPSLPQPPDEPAQPSSDLDEDFLNSLSDEPARRSSKPEEPVTFRRATPSFGLSSLPAPRDDRNDDKFIVESLRSAPESPRPDAPPETETKPPETEPVQVAAASEKASPGRPQAEEKSKKKKNRKRGKGIGRLWNFLLGLFILVLCVAVVGVSYIVFKEVLPLQPQLASSFRPVSLLRGPVYTPTETPIQKIALPATWTPTPKPSLTPTMAILPSLTPEVTLTTTGVPTRPASELGNRPGTYAPNFILTNAFSDSPIVLYDLTGKPVVVYFWNIACQGCRDELLNLQRLYLANRANGLRVEAINEQDKTADVRIYAGNLLLTYDIGLDPDGSIKRLYGVNSFPAGYYIDRTGKILEVKTGLQGPNGLAYNIDLIMK